MFFKYIIIADLSKTTDLYTTQTGNANKFYIVSSEETTNTYSDDIARNSEFTTIYILVGLGPIISLVLFVSVMQCCKMYRSSTKKNKNKQKGFDNDKHRALPNQINQNYQQDYDATSAKSSTGHLYGPFQGLYEEINEKIEIHSWDISNTPKDYETPSTSSKDMTLPMKHIRVDKTFKGFNVTEVNYLTPSHVPELQLLRAKEEKKSEGNIAQL